MIGRRKRLKRRPMPTVTSHLGRVQLEGTAKQALEIGRNRLVVAGAIFALIFAALGARLVDLAILTDGNEPRLAQMTGIEEFKTERAEIHDRNGVLLATSLATASLFADPKLVLDPGEAARRLAAVLPGLGEVQLLAKLSADRRFVWLRRNLTPRQKYEVNRLGLPGLYFQREERRVYPHGTLASHVLGYTDVDNRGIAGIEQAFDDVLRVGTSTPLVLSLDIRIQHLLQTELSAAMLEFGAIGASGLVMDAKTGELLALVSLPDFDSNHAGRTSAERRFNRATLGVYEMGSTFKIFTTAMALDSGKVTMSDGYDATDPIRVSRFTIRDFHAKRRWLSVPEIFMYSSNIGAAKMAIDVGTEGQRAFLGGLGLLRSASIELPEVGAPMVPSPWRDINTMTVAFGHGIAVSPVQLASAVATVVNGGISHPSTLLMRPLGSEAPGHRAVSEQTSENMRKLLRLVVTDGTGRNAAAPGYMVGGKTGTAEKSTVGGYKQKALISSFVAAFPMNDPRYVVLAVLDEPKGTEQTFGYATGGWVAAPTVSRVISQMAPIVSIEPIDESSPDIQEAMLVDLNPRGTTLASY